MLHILSILHRAERYTQANPVGRVYNLYILGSACAEAFRYVRCKSKFTSYVKQYTQMQKPTLILARKSVRIAIKSASCVLNRDGWAFSDTAAFGWKMHIH